MSLLNQILAAAAVTDSEYHEEKVVYKYRQGNEDKEMKFTVGVIRRIPMALSSNMEEIKSLQASPLATRIAQFIVLLDDSEDGRKKFTPTEVDSLDSELTDELAKAIAKHHPKYFPLHAQEKEGDDAEEKPKQKAKKN